MVAVMEMSESEREAEVEESDEGLDGGCDQ